MQILYVGVPGSTTGDLDAYVADLGDGSRLDMAASGRSAIAAAAQSDYDVVIVGPMQANHSPADLLEQIRILRPGAIRIALVEPERMDQRALSRLLGVAHRFLPLPMSAAQLLESVHSYEELRETIDNTRLRTLVGGIDTLPAPPKLYFSLMQTLDDEEGSSSSDVASLVASDPAIAAKVLRLCNSAYFSKGREISDLRSAVTRLGTTTLRELVLASEVFSMASPLAVDRQDLQRRALLASRLPSKMLPESSADLGSTAALLANIGLLLPGVRNECIAPDKTSADDQRPGHAEAGAYLLGLWGLPMPIVEAVAFHRTPRRSSLRSFWVPGAVHVAVALACDEPIDEEYLSSLGVLPKLASWREQASRLAEIGFDS